MRINVIHNETKLHLFDYRSPVIPRIGEVIDTEEVKEEDKGLIVISVYHKWMKNGEPYVNLHCEGY